MFEQALKVAESLQTQRTSKYDEVFNDDEKAELNAFTSWLTGVVGFKSTSASSYRANFSRACVKISAGEKLNSDERSALRKFDEFSKRVVASSDIIENIVEDEDELDD